MSDPLEELVAEYRILTAQPKSREGQRQLDDVREAIIKTKPKGKAGVLAQIEALQHWAWAPPVNRLAASLHRSVDDLWPEGD